MKKIILKVLKDIAKSQINLQAESARQMIADALEHELVKYFGDEIEAITTGTFKNKKK